jgi:repressor of nif and glnA expression
MAFDTQDVERKVLSILRILGDSQEPLGARVIANHLKNYGVELGERAVRYHLKMADERGLTQLIGRDGRILTEKGLEEIKSALVKDKVGFAISKIELLAFRTDFDYENRRGLIPVNVSFFPQDKFNRVVQLMKPIFKKGLCVSDLVVVASDGEKMGEFTVPKGSIGLGTVCSVTLNGALLKAGIPMDSRFGGMLQLQDGSPFRFAELIHYDGSSLDPSEIFIRAKMTSVNDAVNTGAGKILANFREIPALCRDSAEHVIAKLKEANIGGLMIMGNTSEPVCEIPIELNRIGMILIGGMNPVAAVEEAGIEAENHAMSTVIDYKELVNINEL